MLPPIHRFAQFTLDLPSLAALLPAVLPSFLSRQRWFGARSSLLQSTSVVAVFPIPNPEVVAADVLVRVELAEGLPQVYQLVLGLRDRSVVSADSALADIELPGRSLRIYDILSHAVDCEQVLRAVLRTPNFPCEQRVQIERSDALSAMLPPFHARPIVSEQSNSSVVFGHEAIIKVFRRMMPGINPDVEITSFLSAMDFRYAPRFLGAASWVAPDGQPWTLAAVQQFVANQGDGWTDSLRSIQTYFDDPSPQRLRTHSTSARDLGITTAKLHVALACKRELPAFAPEPITPADIEHWHTHVVARLRSLQAAIEDPRMHQFAPQVQARLDLMTAIREPGDKQRVHGDYHLGQVLRAADRWVILDFEGEPGRDLQDRRQKHSPLRDVAGMLRSFNYAVFAALFEQAQPGSEKWEALQPAALEWEDSARGAFLSGWSDTMTAAGMVSTDAQSTCIMLDALELDKAIYEAAYELGHRPAWLDIPLHGMTRIISRRSA